MGAQRRLSRSQMLTRIARIDLLIHLHEEGSLLRTDSFTFAWLADSKRYKLRARMHDMDDNAVSALLRKVEAQAKVIEDEFTARGKKK